jgi:two-component system response regulator YesN
MKIVVVEDEVLARRGIILSIDWAALGCVVVGEASNGEEGFEVVRRYSPDLIITDVRMPRLDGLEMVKRLRDAGCAADVIILTAHGDFDYTRQALRLGAVDYLLKPFHNGELEKAVTAVKQRLGGGRRENPLREVLEAPARAKNKFVQRALDYIAENYASPGLGVENVADYLGVSASHLNHVFKKETAYTLKAYLTDYRIHAAMAFLGDCRNRVYEVAEKVGYRDIAYFSSIFKKRVGIPPSEFQNRG